MKHELWPHQVETLDNLRATIGQGVKRIVVQSPTGSGKTQLAAAIVEGARDKGNRVAFVVPAISLVSQTLEMFWANGIKDVGVIQAKHELEDWSRPVQVCSIQTINRRSDYPKAEIVIIDEVHQLHEAHRKWLGHEDWKGKPFIGLSATPYTKGLGKYFETMLVAATIDELIEKGLLSKFKVYATGHPDLSNVKIVGGDYHEGQLSEVMREVKLTADIVETWKKRWGKDKTFVFGVDRLHAKTLQARFEEAGISCAYQDAYTEDADRREIKRKFHSGDYRVIANCATLTTGVDYDVRCLVLARPTRSTMLYQQIVGRALRTAPGKDHAIILDHSDTTMRLGLVTDIYQDHLDDGKEHKANGSQERKKPLPVACKKCDYLMPPSSIECPSCGERVVRISRHHEEDGELVEYVPGAGVIPKAKDAVFTLDQKREFFAQLVGFGQYRGYAKGWASHKFKERFGHWPQFHNVDPREPTMVVMAYIKKTQAAWVRSKIR